MMIINGLRLPSELVAAIESDRWHPPAEASVYVEVFGDEPDLPDFYDLTTLERENRSWRDVSAEEFFSDPTADGNLGISFELSVVIADLGPDMPVALDYRLSPEQPRVLYLGGGDVPRWSEVAPSIGRLLELLKLAESEG